jgi:hypothetical protein
MSERANNVRLAADTVRGALNTVVDEIRLKAHLASMEARDAFDTLEPQLRKVESKLQEYQRLMKDTGDEASLQAHLAMMDARDRWESMQDDVDGVVASIRKRGEDVSGAIDHARLQGHLARLDAEEEIDKRREQLESRWHSSKETALDEAAAFMERMADKVDRFRDRLGEDGEAKDE